MRPFHFQLGVNGHVQEVELSLFSVKGVTLPNNTLDRIYMQLLHIIDFWTISLSLQGIKDFYKSTKLLYFNSALYLLP